MEDRLMDDSEDFVDLCSKLLRRVRKREAGERKYTEDESRPPNGVKERAKRKRLRIDSNQVLEGPRGSQTTNRSQASFSLRSDERGGLKKALEDAVVVARPTPEVTVPESTLKQQPLRAKDKVVSRMQQFKWVSPQKLKLNGCEEPGSEKLHVGILTPPREQEPTATPAPDPQGDEALALRLQQELDREAQSDLVDLEEGGLFFCQICQRDLSAMNALCRAQHINRCLDKSEDRAPPMRAPPQIPECPICGKGFKSEKSKVAHLKRCSTDMGVAPAVLMEALQRQAAEVAERGSSTNQPPLPDRPKKKGPRKKPVTLDEDTMVAMALSRSMLEQDKEKEVLQEGQRGAAQALSAQPLGSRAGRGKTCRKKGAPPAPPPLLLIQDPRDVLLRLQNRIAALLLRTQPERPPTPRLPASSLALWTGAAPLWQKSALREGGPLSTLDFYTPELKPWVPANVVKLNPEGPCQTAAGTPRDSLLEARCSSSPSPAAKRSEPIPPPASSPPPVGNQTLCDLMDLAEEGMTLTQYGGVTTWAHTHTYKEQLDPLPNGFEPVAEAAAQSTAPLSRLATDLASMVNNPQLSDVQLQVDSGDVFFTHSFVLYARCPLLAQSVHDSGFGVQEEGMPLVQRVLLGEVPVDAVLALLQYLYTGCCPLTPALVTRVQELAVRFQLKELQELCQQHAGKIQLEPWGMELEQNDEEEEARNKEQNFMELLHSMWDGEEEEEEGGIHGKYRQEGTGSPLLGDVEPGDERVDEDELEEIYEFAATQRKLESGGNIGEDDEEEDGEDCHADTEEGEGLMERGGGDCMSGKRLSLVKAGVFIEKLNSQGTDEPKEDSPPSQDSMVSCHSLRDGSAAGSPPEGQVYQMTADMMEQPALFTVSCAEAAMGPDDTGLVGSSKPSSVHSPNTSADRSYSRLFSQSWGTYTEPSPSQPPHHTPSASLAADFQCMEQPAVGVFTPVPSRASGHQGVVIDLSVSPSPDPLESSLPITGVSPGSTEGKDPEVIGKSSSFAGDPEVPLGHSQTETSHVEKCIPSSSGKTICSTRDTRPVTPDLIVVSDSGDEMDFITGNMEAKLPPISNQQPQISVNVGEKAVNPEVHSCNAHAPVRLSPSLPMNGSAEISWLIPFTPVQPHKTTQTGSTQTYSSMCRTNLFISGVPPNASSTPLHLKVPDRLCAARPSLPQSDHVLGSIRKSPICRVTGNRIQSADERCSENQQGDDPGSLHLSVILPSPWRDAEIGSRLRESPDKHGFLAGPNCIESSDMARFSKSNGNLPEGEEASSLAQQPRELGQFCAAEEPPIPFDDSWGEGAHFSLRMDSSGGVSPPSLIPPAIGQDTPKNIPEPSATMLDSKLWDEWEGDEEEDLDLPLSQRACPRGAAPRVAQLRTPVASHRKGNPPLEPITPMPAFSDMETPELKNQLNKFGVRPLPKRQMVSKLREIHHYTHQLLSSDSESEGLVLSPDPPKAAAFKEPTGIMLKTCPKAPPTGQGEDGQRDGDEEVLSASQSSTTSSAAASEDSNRSNPELCPQSDDDSDSDGLTPSQAVSRDAAKLQAVRNFLQSDSELYGQILQYQPLVLAHLQARLKAAGIRLGAAKLLDFLDSQCITFTTANRTKPSVSRRRGLGRGRGRRRGGKAKALSTARCGQTLTFVHKPDVLLMGLREAFRLGVDPLRRRSVVPFAVEAVEHQLWRLGAARNRRAKEKGIGDYK
ncbi:structure-specific endonuclease subunit SLX4-like, partial [Scleropages formosus]